MSAGRMGVFGGTFDPIHIGHLAAAQDAAAALGLTRVLFVPNRIPPHKQNRRVSSVEDRVAMVELAVADNPLFELSRVELEREGPSYTLDTMRQLRQQMGGAEPVFLTGVDALAALHTWNQPDVLLAEFPVVFLDRPAAAEIDWDAVERHFPGLRQRARIVCVPQLEISAHDLRRRVRTGEPIRYYVLPSVQAYIDARGLYRAEEGA